MFNPRFPHTLRIVNARMDDNGDIVTDEEGHIIYDPVKITAVQMDGPQPMLDAEGRFITYEVDELPFGYRTASENTRQMGEVVYSDYRLATPMMLTHVEYGQRLILTDYDHSFEAVVVKQTTFNIGTNIWCNDVKN